MLPTIEAELKKHVARVNSTGSEELQDMLAYHMGWQGEGAGPQAQGKRVRPFLMLFTTAAAGGGIGKARSPRLRPSS